MLRYILIILAFSPLIVSSVWLLWAVAFIGVEKWWKHDG